MHPVDVLSQEVFKCELVVEKDGGTAFHELPWAPETVKSKQAPPTNLDPLQLYTHVHAGEHFFKNVLGLLEENGSCLTD